MAVVDSEAMFENYTEGARRAVFFARHEANQMGAPAIDTEHLLLGLLREGAPALGRLLPARVSLDRVRRQVERSTPFRHRAQGAVETPLSAGAKNVLRRAAEEADVLSHGVVRPEHFLLGLLREEGTLCARLLREAEVGYAAVRKRCEEDAEG